jgi:hypothetical protein
VRYLLNEEPTPRFTAATFWEFITGSMLLRGDGFAVLIRNGAGNVKEVIPVPSECVTVKRDGNRLIYVIWSLYNDNYSVDIKADRPRPGRRLALSRLRLQRAAQHVGHPLGGIPGDRLRARDGAVRGQHDA